VYLKHYFGFYCKSKTKECASKFLGYTFLVYRTVFANEDENLKFHQSLILVIFHVVLFFQ
jgi:hypothetical protein